MVRSEWGIGKGARRGNKCDLDLLGWGSGIQDIYERPDGVNLGGSQ